MSVSPCPEDMAPVNNSTISEGLEMLTWARAHGIPMDEGTREFAWEILGYHSDYSDDEDDEDEDSE